MGLAFSSPSEAAAEPVASAAVVQFRHEIKPMLEKYCFDCHGDGSRKGKVAFDEFASDSDLVAKTGLWLAALKNVRAGLMPPDDGPRPTAAEVESLGKWVKYQAFGLDPANLDPGHVTARRLNRAEYRNTIRDLMGVDFNSEAEFPPDDTGHGFDNIGEVLTISPLHLEKYMEAAESIVNTAVPKMSYVMEIRPATGRDFVRDDGSKAPENLPVGRPTRVSRSFNVEHDEDYRVAAELQVRGSFDFDPSRGNLIFTVDGQKRHEEKVTWSESRTIKLNLPERFTAGDHVVAVEIEPLEPVATPATSREPTAPSLLRGDRTRPPEVESVPDIAIPASLLVAPTPAVAKTRLEVRIVSVQVTGPANKAFWVAPQNHARFFPRGPAPTDPVGRDAYAREVLHSFAKRAFRRPVDEAKVDQLVAVARSVYEQPGKTFEEGFAQAAIVVLASPRFLFLPEPAARTPRAGAFVEVDEFALASRLSYLLWSSMPDDELLRAAAAGQLRANQAAQVTRMLVDARSQTFVKNFTGQWLQVRDVEFVPINPRAVLGLKTRRGGPRVDFDAGLRRAMRTETEMTFDHILREDRSLLELIDSNYTFVNAKLASHYGIAGVSGDTFRKVELPADSPRGGVLTQASVLAVTSNPTRTSPVKRGLFILENILGTPPPPPPPDIPALEEAKKDPDGHELPLRELLAAHRADPVCSSCHQRMDPLGLAFENFNALGLWRDLDANQPITAAGQLATGEAFADVRELKRVLTHERRLDYYRCVTEKLLVYALGRGLDYRDVEAVDQIVDRLDKEKGRFSVLLNGVIQSTAFQKQRSVSPPAPATTQLTRSPSTGIEAHLPSAPAASVPASNALN